MGFKVQIFGTSFSRCKRRMTRDYLQKTLTIKFNSLFFLVFVVICGFSSQRFWPICSPAFKAVGIQNQSKIRFSQK